MKKLLPYMILIGIIVTTFAACTTTRYGVQIGNVPNVREVHIRNAGAAHWGANLAGSLGNIDRSSFSERVDIRVVDTNGIVHSRYDVPFGAGVFSETGRSRSINTFAGLGLLGGLIALLAIL